jgi:hypothetical protein
MKRIIIILLSGITTIQFVGCNDNKYNSKEESRESMNKNSLITKDSVNNVQISYDSNFSKKPLVKCKLVQSPEQKEQDDFLNSNIAFFDVQSLPDENLINADYCRFVLSNTHFLAIAESNFNPDNFEFTQLHVNIDNYGECYIGKYYFPSAINAAQRRAIVIINLDTKELSILNFEDIKFVNGNLNCDFSIRGKHFLYKLKYSIECKRFIQSN